MTLYENYTNLQRRNIAGVLTIVPVMILEVVAEGVA